MNKVWKKSPGETIGLVKKTLEEVENATKADVKLEEIANLDETSIQIFSLLVMRLAYMGQKSVRGKGNNSRLALSCPVVWRANGELDIIIVWSSKNKSEQGTPRWETNKGGITWFRADSKWTNKKTYTKIIRHFVALDPGCKVFLDDMARGHGGYQPHLCLTFFRVYSSLQGGGGGGSPP